MADDDLCPGEMTPLRVGVRRLVAPNPGMMTGPGTNTYLLGERNIAVVDPGPSIDVHIDRIVAEAGGTIRWILVTHTHPDHSPAAAKLAEMTGAQRLGMPPPVGLHQDGSFAPDRVLAHGDALEHEEFTLQALHTPGHASNHLCYWHAESGWLFTGDHIINGSTVVIDPPDGNMSHYLAALRQLLDYPLAALAPGHGGLMQSPHTAIGQLIEHRLRREAKVAEKLSRQPVTLSELVKRVYDEIDSSLHRLAEPVAARASVEAASGRPRALYR